MRNILFIPGLGDEESLTLIKKYWRIKNRNISIFDTKWSEQESGSDKFARLCRYYEKMQDKDLEVICISAGGSLTTQLLAKYPDISKATFVSTKVKGSNTIGASFQKRAPGLLESVLASEQALKSVDNFQDKVVVYRPLLDGVVPLKDMLVGTSKRKRVLAIGHPMGIGLALIFYIR